MGRLGFRTLCCDVFGLLKNQFLRNNNNKSSRSNVNKHELAYGESSSNARDAPDVCLSFVLLFTIFIIVVTQKLVLQPSKNVAVKCTEPQSPPHSIQFSLNISIVYTLYIRSLNALKQYNAPLSCISITNISHFISFNIKLQASGAYTRI